MIDGGLDWIRHVAAPLLAVDGRGLVHAANAAARSLLGDVPAGTPLNAALGVPPARDLLDRIRAPGPAELDCRLPGGATRLAVAASPLPGPTPLLLLTLERCARAALPPERLEAVLDGLPVGVEIFDQGFSELFANAHSAVMFGYAPGEIGELEAWWELGYPDPDYRRQVRDAWYADVARALAGNAEVDMGEWIVTCKDGSRKAVHFRFRTIGELHVLVYWDVTERHRLEAELRTLAGTDPLTGLLNRRQLFAEAEAAIEAARADGAPLSLLLLDLDHFKQVNDRHGHGVGDRVLEEVSARCRDTLGPGELIGRTGGEEFAVLAAGRDRHGAVALARLLSRALTATPLAVGTLRIGIDVSIGVASLAEGEGVDDLLDRADRALYVAKRAGRGRVRFLGLRKGANRRGTAE